MAKTLTSATTVFALSVRNLFPTPVALQGFATDDVFDTESLASAEVMMGVDGNMSAGFVYVPVKQGITLQADSDSNDIFDDWWAANQVNADVFFADAIITIPAIQKQWTMTKGVLSQWKPLPDVKKLLQARKYEITWSRVLPSNTQ